jgi:hypothetical protein
MKYAIRELRNNANNYNTSKHLKDLAKDFFNAANFLEDKEFESFTYGFVYAELSEYKNRVLNGLNNWGSNYQEQKKRQEDKLKEINKAIEKLKTY